MTYRPLQAFDIGWFEEKVWKHQHSKKLREHLYKKKYRIYFDDGPTFLLSVNELFVSEYYKFKTISNEPRIIDCGSYIGTSILFFKVNYPEARIIGFEPDHDNYSILSRNLQNWNFSNTEVKNAAIWLENGTVSFNSAGNMSSKINIENSDYNSSSMINCVRLRDLLEEQVDFLKIDIEGAEYEVLKDCQDRLCNVKNLFVEYHGKYNELFKLNDILTILLENNFKYYIKEGISVYARPFWDKEKIGEYDLLLNISAFRD